MNEAIKQAIREGVPLVVSIRSTAGHARGKGGIYRARRSFSCCDCAGASAP